GVRVPELLVGVDEWAGAGDAGGGIDDLVAVHATAPALDLVLRPQRQRLSCCACELHTVIVGNRFSAPQVLTNGPRSGMAARGANRAASTGQARRRVLTANNGWIG